MAQIMGSDLSSRMKDGGHEADDVKQVKRDRSRMIVRRRKGSAGRAASLVSPGPLARPCPAGRHARVGRLFSGTIPFRGAARCETSEAIPHKDATTTRNSTTGSLPRSRRESRRGADHGTRMPAAHRRRRSTSRPVIAIAASISSCSACHPSPLRAAIRAGAATGRRRRRMAGAQGREGDARLFLQADRNRGQNRRWRRETRRIPILRTFSVFHTSQIDGVPSLEPTTATKTVPERVKDVELIIEASGVPVRIGGERAFYNPALDVIQMPPDEAFHSPEVRASSFFMNWRMRPATPPG